MTMQRGAAWTGLPDDIVIERIVYMYDIIMK